MLKWALIFFLISVVTGVLGFTNVSAGAAGIAKVAKEKCDNLSGEAKDRCQREAKSRS